MERGMAVRLVPHRNLAGEQRRVMRGGDGRGVATGGGMRGVVRDGGMRGVVRDVEMRGVDQPLPDQPVLLLVLTTLGDTNILKKYIVMKVFSYKIREK